MPPPEALYFMKHRHLKLMTSLSEIRCTKVDPPGRSHRQWFSDFSVNGVVMGPTMGPTMSGPKSMGHSAMGQWAPYLWHGSSINGWGHVLWIITWVGWFAPGSFFVGVNNVVTHVIMGSPILRRRTHVQNSFSLEASVAPQRRSTLRFSVCTAVHFSPLHVWRKNLTGTRSSVSKDWGVFIRHSRPEPHA